MAFVSDEVEFVVKIFYLTDHGLQVAYNNYLTIVKAKWKLKKKAKGKKERNQQKRKEKLGKINEEKKG